jgi:hypothetical protein
MKIYEKKQIDTGNLLIVAAVVMFVVAVCGITLQAQWANEIPPEGGTTNAAQMQSLAPVAAGWTDCLGLFIQIDDVARAAQSKRLKCPQNPEVRIACGKRAATMTFEEFCGRVFEDRVVEKPKPKRR